ncbi:hypothetical protein J3E71DRAFT_235909 [Bipolaris maydis]|nr:hypothetical protein J3E71DRAFT_235909 [Bipolaris maydis]
MPALACLCQSRRGAWRSTHADAAPQTPAAHGHHGHENANGRCAHDACGHAPTPCPADDMCGSSLPPNRRPSESTSSRIPAEIALICSGKTALMHPWVHFDMFLTLPRPSSSMSRAKSPPWREPPAGVLTAIHTPSALPRPRAGAGHDSMHLPCARRQPGQQPRQQPAPRTYTATPT